MDYSYGKQKSFFPAGSTATQSGWQFAGDFKRLSVQISGTGSNFTIEGSDDDGFVAAIQNVSTLTVITTAGMYPLEPGARWIRLGRPASTVTATLAGSAF